MNVKLKSSIIIIVTFVFGMIAGALLNQTYLEYKMKKILSMRKPEGFAAHFERIIEPTNDQRKAVHEILLKYGKRIFEVGERFRKEFFPIPPEMKHDLDKILNPQQKKRLQEYFMKFGPPGFSRPFREGHPPGPGPHPWPGENENKPGRPVGPI